MTLVILSYNILDGGGDRLPLIAHVIQKSQPDVLLQHFGSITSLPPRLLPGVYMHATLYREWMLKWLPTISRSGLSSSENCSHGCMSTRTGSRLSVLLALYTIVHVQLLIQEK